MSTIKEINNRDNQLIEQLLAIWERSVRASHTFLTEEGITNIKQYVPEAIKGVSHLLVSYSFDNPIGFLGVNDRKVEMLFIDDNLRGQGIGGALIEEASRLYDINEVDVNEDNPLAHAFYLKNGFIDISRDEFDEQGNPYPIIHMRLG